MESRIKKIISVNTADHGGGAERIVSLLFDAFGKLGVESWLVVGDKKSTQERVLPFYLSPYFDYRPYATRLRQWQQRAAKRFCLASGIEDFEFPYSKHLLELTGAPPDLVHLHNLHGGYFDLRALPRLSEQVPVFLTLEDAWMITGHCAFPMECGRWQVGCGECPDLARPPAVGRDATAFNWWRKARIFERARLYCISPSQWMLDLARRSILAPAIADARVIPHGIDLETFCPGDRTLARSCVASLAPGVPPGAQIIVSASFSGRNNPFKDWSVMRQALELLERGVDDPPLHLLLAGGTVSTERIGQVTVHHLGYLSHPQLAELYRAADLFVHSTRAETFGLVVAEAMACGLPVVVTQVGATSEVTGVGRGGVLVPLNDPESLANEMRNLLGNPEKRRLLGEEAARHALEHFDSRRMVADHLDYFEKVISEWRSERGDYVGDVTRW